MRSAFREPTYVHLNPQNRQTENDAEESTNSNEHRLVLISDWGDEKWKILNASPQIRGPRHSHCCCTVRLTIRKISSLVAITFSESFVG